MVIPTPPHTPVYRIPPHRACPLRYSYTTTLHTSLVDSRQPHILGRCFFSIKFTPFSPNGCPAESEKPLDYEHLSDLVLGPAGEDQTRGGHHSLRNHCIAFGHKQDCERLTGGRRRRIYCGKYRLCHKMQLRRIGTFVLDSHTRNLLSLVTPNSIA